MDFALFFLARASVGDSWKIAEIERSEWTVKVTRDSAVFYYDVSTEHKEDFEDWASQVFGEEPDLVIIWR